MKLTREQVEEIRKSLTGAEFVPHKGEDVATAKLVNDAVNFQLNALCDLALTALSAEPVAVTDDDGGVWFYGTAGAKCPFKPGTKLFTAPPSLLAENKRLRGAFERHDGDRGDKDRHTQSYIGEDGRILNLSDATRGSK